MISSRRRSLITIGSFIGATILFILFIWIESKVAEPLLKLSILNPKPRCGGLAVMAVICGMHFATLFLIPQYFQPIVGYNPLLAGFAYLPLTIAVSIVSNFVPRLVAKFGIRLLLVIGSILVAASLLGFSKLTSTSTYLGDVLLPLLVHSIGIVLIFIPGSIVILDDVDDQDAGVASGIMITALRSLIMFNFTGLNWLFIPGLFAIHYIRFNQDSALYTFVSLLMFITVNRIVYITSFSSGGP